MPLPQSTCRYKANVNALASKSKIRSRVTCTELECRWPGQKSVPRSTCTCPLRLSQPSSFLSTSTSTCFLNASSILYLVFFLQYLSIDTSALLHLFAIHLPRRLNNYIVFIFFVLLRRRIPGARPPPPRHLAFPSFLLLWQTNDPARQFSANCKWAITIGMMVVTYHPSCFIRSIPSHRMSGICRLPCFVDNSLGSQVLCLYDSILLADLPP